MLYQKISTSDFVKIGVEVAFIMLNTVALLALDADAEFLLFFNSDDQLCIEFSIGGAIESTLSMSLQSSAPRVK